MLRKCINVKEKYVEKLKCIPYMRGILVTENRPMGSTVSDCLSPVPQFLFEVNVCKMCLLHLMIALISCSFGTSVCNSLRRVGDLYHQQTPHVSLFISTKRLYFLIGTYKHCSLGVMRWMSLDHSNANFVQTHLQNVAKVSEPTLRYVWLTVQYWGSSQLIPITN